MSNRLGHRTRLLGPMLNARVAQWMQRSLIKSVQRNTITIAALSLTNTRAITSVDVNNTRLVFLGSNTTDNGAGGSGSGPVLARVDLTNATTVTATRTATDNATIVSFDVIEYWPGVLRTVQRGTVTATGAATGTATLATTLQSVSKASIEFLGWSGSVAFTPDNFLGYIDLTNTTTVTLTRTGTNGNLTAGYQVTEWY